MSGLKESEIEGMNNQDDGLFGNSGEDFSSFLQKPLPNLEQTNEVVSGVQNISLSVDDTQNMEKNKINQTINQQENNEKIIYSVEHNDVKDEPLVDLQSKAVEINLEPESNDLGFNSSGEDDLFGGSSEVQDFGSMIMLHPPPTTVSQVATQEIIPDQCFRDHEYICQQQSNVDNNHSTISSPPPSINTSFPSANIQLPHASTNSNNNGSTSSPPPLRSTGSTSSISSRNRYVNSFGTQTRSTFSLPASTPPPNVTTQGITSLSPQLPPINTNDTFALSTPPNGTTGAIQPSIPQYPPVNGTNFSQIPFVHPQVPNHSFMNTEQVVNQYNTNRHNITSYNNNKSAVMEGYSSSPSPSPYDRNTPTQLSPVNNMGVNNNQMMSINQMGMGNMGIANNSIVNTQMTYNAVMNNSMMISGQMMNNYGMMNNNPSSPNNLLSNNMNNPHMMNQQYPNPMMNHFASSIMNNSMIQRSMSPSYQQNQTISRQILNQEIELRKTYPKPIFCFSFDGKIITSLPTINQHSQLSNTFIHQQRTQALHYQPGLFKIQKLNQLINYRLSIIKSLEDYPITNISQQFDESNSNNISILLDQLVKYMNLKIYEKQQALIQDNDEKCMGEKMLWDLIKIVSKYVNGNANMINGDINSLLTVLINNVTTEVPINSENEQTSFNEAEYATSIQNLLINGQIKQACQFAQTNKMWSHAILLSSMIDKQTYQQVVSTFSKSTLNLGSPLRTLYCTFAGKPFDAFEVNNSVSIDQYGNQFSSQTSQNEQQQLEKLSSQWMQNISIMFNNRQGATSQSVIEKIGDMLWKDCYQVPQSHFCYMIGDLSAIISAFTIASNYQVATSNQPPKEVIQQQSQQAMLAISNILSTSIVNKRVILLGGDNKRDIRHYINEETIQLSEIFELLKAIITKNCLTAIQEQNVPPISLIINSSLLTYKLVYAYYLAEFGYLEKANECCDYLIDIVKRTQQSVKFNNYFKLNLQELKNRIIESNRLNGVVTPVKKTTPNTGTNSGVTGWFIKGLESIIHGDSPTTPAESTTTLIQTSVVNTNSMIPNNMQQSPQVQHQFNIGQGMQGNPIRSSTPTNMIPPSNHSVQTPPSQNIAQIPPSSNSAQTPPPHSNQTNGGSYDEGSGVGGWFKSLWGGKANKKEANIGKKNEYYYDETKKRWLRRGQENEVEQQVQAPPPSLQSISATTLQSAASQMRGGAGRYVNMFSGNSPTQQPISSGNAPPMMPNMPPPMMGQPINNGNVSPSFNMPIMTNMPPQMTSMPPSFFTPKMQ